MHEQTFEKTDVALIQDIRKGDQQAFDILFLKYYPALCAYAKEFVGYDDREEVVQDVMVWLWENREKITIETSPKHYLFRAVKNNCFTWITRNDMKQHVSTVFHQRFSIMEDPDFYVVEELQKRIEDVLSRLPATYREAFELNRFHNMTYQEIADKLKISSKTVDYRIQQALKILRTELKDYLPLLFFLIG